MWCRKIFDMNDIDLTSSHNAEDLSRLIKELKEVLKNNPKEQLGIASYYSRPCIEIENECEEGPTYRPVHALEFEIPEDNSKVPVELEADDRYWERIPKFDPRNKGFENDKLLRLLDLDTIEDAVDNNLELPKPRLVGKLSETKFQSKSTGRIVTYALYKDIKEILRKKYTSKRQEAGVPSIEEMKEEMKQNGQDQIYKKLGLVETKRRHKCNRSKFVPERQAHEHQKRKQKFYLTKSVHGVSYSTSVERITILPWDEEDEDNPYVRTEEEENNYRERLERLRRPISRVSEGGKGSNILKRIKDFFKNLIPRKRDRDDVIVV